MIPQSPDRPQPRPRPAPDHGDPAEPSRGTPPPPPEEAPKRRRGAEPTVQLNTRVAPVIGDLVTKVGEARGWSKRETVEYALRQAFPDEFREVDAASKRDAKQARKRAS